MSFEGWFFCPFSYISLVHPFGSFLYTSCIFWAALGTYSFFFKYIIHIYPYKKTSVILLLKDKKAFLYASNLLETSFDVGSQKEDDFRFSPKESLHMLFKQVV